jgi:hypothetical protein
MPAADLHSVEQDILEDLGFSLDLIYLASGLGCNDSHCGASSTPPEVEELEVMLRAVLASAESELGDASRP